MSAYEVCSCAVREGVVCRRDILVLPDLLRLIADSDDRLALKEFHDCRPVFRRNGGGPLLLVQFVESLCETPQAMSMLDRDRLLLERAYDLTIDKFMNLPLDNGAASGARRNGPDCRRYFRNFLQTM